MNRRIRPLARGFARHLVGVVLVAAVVLIYLFVLSRGRWL